MFVQKCHEEVGVNFEIQEGMKSLLVPIRKLPPLFRLWEYWGEATSSL
jgi:hypothetical protein